MAEWHRKTPFDFAITLGDNFYSAGMSSPTDPRWKILWDELYDPLGIKFYATLGNHDWVMSDSPAAEILYSDRSPSWRMPSPYYTFTAGPVQFFALDTNEVSDAQLAWFDGELKKSTSKWKIVYAHHPIYSDGEHGDNPVLAQKLLPLLRSRVDVYLAGHDHILNHVKPEGGVEFFVSGGAGAGLYRLPSELALCLWNRRTAFRFWRWIRRHLNEVHRRRFKAALRVLDQQVTASIQIALAKGRSIV